MLYLRWASSIERWVGLARYHRFLAATMTVRQEGKRRVMSAADVRVGIIGCGHIARGAHAPGYHRAGATMVACADVVPERAQRFAQDFGMAHWYQDYHQLLDRDDIDAVSVTVPNRFHQAVVDDALARGKHVLCEKPMAVDRASAQKMRDRARQAKRILMIGFQNRFRPEVQRLKTMITQGDLGPIRYARAGWMRRRGSGWGWYSNQDISGGGAFIDIGVHALDLAYYLLGSPTARTVSAMTYQQFGRYQLAERVEWQSADASEGLDDGSIFTVEDSGMALIHFDNGSALFLEAAWASNLVESESLFVDLSGDRAGAHLFPLELYEERHGTLMNTRPSIPGKDASSEEIRQFLGDIQQGREWPQMNTPDEGLAIQSLIDAVYRSARRGGVSVEVESREGTALD